MQGTRETEDLMNEASTIEVGSGLSEGMHIGDLDVLYVSLLAVRSPDFGSTADKDCPSALWFPS
jgi:hypothetical protein